MLHFILQEAVAPLASALVQDFLSKRYQDGKSFEPQELAHFLRESPLGVFVEIRTEGVHNMLKAMTSQTEHDELDVAYDEGDSFVVYQVPGQPSKRSETELADDTADFLRELLCETPERPVEEEPTEVVLAETKGTRDPRLADAIDHLRVAHDSINAIMNDMHSVGDSNTLYEMICYDIEKLIHLLSNQ